MEGDHQQILGSPSLHEKDLIQMETENYDMGKEGDPHRSNDAKWAPIFFI